MLDQRVRSSQHTFHVGSCFPKLDVSPRFVSHTTRQSKISKALLGVGSRFQPFRPNLKFYSSHSGDDAMKDGVVKIKYSGTTVENEHGNLALVRHRIPATDPKTRSRHPVGRASGSDSIYCDHVIEVLENYNQLFAHSSLDHLQMLLRIGRS